MKIPGYDIRTAKGKMVKITVQAISALVLGCLMLFFSHGVEWHRSAAAANNPPHDASHGINCSACHLTFSQEATSPVWNFTPDPVNPDNNQVNNRICWQAGCHTGATAKKTHSRYSSDTTRYSTWSWTCTTCHDPHKQLQTKNLTSVPTLKGTTTTVDGVNKIFGLSLTLPDRTGDAGPANDYVGWTIVPNTTYKNYNYKIIANTANTVTVEGTIVTAGVKANVSQFALIPGKYLRDVITTPAGPKAVTFLQFEGPNSFVHNDGLAAGNDSTPDGVCQVCHAIRPEGAAMKHARADGTGLLGDTHPTTTAANCKPCHDHQTLGFGSGGCTSCHGLTGNGAPILDTERVGYQIDGNKTGHTAGAHEKHVVTKGYVCAICHNNNGMPTLDNVITVAFSGAATGGSYQGKTLNAPFTYSAGIATGATESCSNIYCHGSTMSNAGDRNGGTNITPVWDNPATAVCGTCHGATAANPPRRGSHDKHTRAYLNGYNYSCGLCHKDPNVDQALHVNNKSEIVFSSNAMTTGGTYSGTDSMLDAYGTCTNIYCHSSVQSSPPGGAPIYRVSPVWGNYNSLGCAGCHLYTGASDPPMTGSHMRHLDYPDMQECDSCHNYNNTDEWCLGCHDPNTIEVQRDKHANHAIDVAFAPRYSGSYTGSPAPGDAYGNCSNTYCHSNGTSVSSGSVPANISPDWGSGTLSCNACHGFPPNYASGSPKANSHSAHAGKTCNYCHAATTSDGTGITNYENHVNRAYNLQAGGGASFSYSYSTTGGTCSTISCHNNGNATWGSNACDSCHGAPPSTGAHKTHFDGLASGAAYGDDGKITDDPQRYKFNCGNCHPMNRARHADGTVDVELYNASAAGFKMNNPATASRTGTGVSTVCNDVYCHSNGADGPNKTYKATPQWGSTFLNNRCAGCHDDPPQYAGQSHYTPDGYMGREGGHLVGIHFDNIHSGTSGLIPPGGPAGSGAAHGDPNTATTMSCNTCHAATVTATNQQSAQGTAFACTTCHGMPQEGSIADKTKHVNGSRDVVFMTGTVRSKAQLSDAAFSSLLQPMGWTRNNGYKLGTNSHDSVNFSGSYNADAKTCVTACHLNQPATWGDTAVTCISCHTDL